MKHTIKLTTQSAIVVQPAKPGAGGLVLGIQHRNGAAVSSEEISLTAEQVGALMFALGHECKPAVVAA